MIDTSEIRAKHAGWGIINNLCDEIDRLNKELSLIKEVRENLVDEIDKSREAKNIGVGFICDIVEGKFADMEQVKRFGQLHLDEMNKLRREKQSPQGKTVLVRIPVSVSPRGDWMGCGGSAFDDHQAVGRCGHEPETDVIYWLTADLPVPEEVTVTAEVENE